MGGREERRKSGLVRSSMSLRVGFGRFWRAPRRSRGRKVRDVLVVLVVLVAMWPVRAVVMNVAWSVRGGRVDETEEMRAIESVPDRREVFGCGTVQALSTSSSSAVVFPLSVLSAIPVSLDEMARLASNPTGTPSGPLSGYDSTGC